MRLTYWHKERHDQRKKSSRTINALKKKQVYKKAIKNLPSK